MHTATKSNVPSDLVPVGYITGAYGVQGWVKIHPHSPDASALLHAKTWWLSKSDRVHPNSVERNTAGPSDIMNQVHDVEKLEAKRHGDGVIARMMGIVGRDAAESLKGFVVQIQRSHFPVLANNEFYWLDLIGLAVENCQGESLGEVVDLIDNGAHPILRVVQKEAELMQSKQASSRLREHLIPFVEQFVPTVDQKNKKIIVDWGLDY